MDDNEFTITWADPDDLIDNDGELYALTTLGACPIDCWCPESMKCTCKNSMKVKINKEYLE